MDSGIRSARNPESGKFLLVESGILGFGIRNTAQGIRNPTYDWNPESKFHWQSPESRIWNPRREVHNPGLSLGFPYIGWTITTSCTTLTLQVDNEDLSKVSYLILFLGGCLSFSILLDTYKEFNPKTGDDTQNSCEAHLQKHQQQQTT